MPLVRVDEQDDPRLDAYRQLKRTNRTRWTGRFIAEGEKLVDRLLGVRWPLDSLLVARRHLPRFEGRVPAELTVLVVPDELVEQLVGFNFHRGVLACGPRPAEVGVERLAKAASAACLLVGCLEVCDPENLGSIIRTAHALGADGVLVDRAGADPFSRRVLRVSMGSVFQIPLAVSRDPAADLDWLGRHAFERVATVVDPAAEPLAGFRRPPRLIVLVGNEGHGLAEAWLDRCDRRLTIPMRHSVDSLNVSVAAAIVLYHLARGPGG